MAVSVDGIVLDIEGTVSSIDFVFRTMFPYVRRELDVFLGEHFAQPEVQNACRRIAAEGNLTQFQMLGDHQAVRPQAIRLIRDEVIRLMDGDVKSTGLKELQGLIWRRGFESGELVAQVFSDVPQRLKEWSAAGIKLFIYSSGSVAAQKLFFGHTEYGDLRGFLHGYFDTTTGPKREPSSYAAIANACGIPAGRLLFVSDVVAELSAAASVGYQAALSLRPGNPPQESAERWLQVSDFSQLRVRR
jgi:enolase-phosphatase E1